MKRCRYCNKQIQDHAAVCPFCRKQLSANGETQPRTNTKKCPYCAEDIQAAAIVCKHCGRPLGDGAEVQQPTGGPGCATKGCLVAVGVGLGLVGLVVLVAVVGSRARSSQQPTASTAPEFAPGEEVVVEAGYRLFPSLEAFRAFAACEASRDYDNQKVAGRYARDAESAGDVMRAAQAKAYADKQAALVCRPEGRVTKGSTPATLTRVERLKVVYEGLIPKVAASQPKVVGIDRSDTVYLVKVFGSEVVVSQGGVRSKDKAK